jgi:hypothetical protein
MLTRKPWIHFSEESFSRCGYTLNDPTPFAFPPAAWQDMTGAGNETTFEYILKKPAPGKTYGHRFTNDDFDIWHMSPGYIRINEYKADDSGDQWATGQFLIETSTPFIEGSTGTPPPSRIEGNFKLRMD